MTRIIAGSAGGRRLRTPAGSGTRPTSDRVREALFSRLAHLDALAGAHVLDLYAGSGALGLEALSRGAASAQLVESDRRAAQVCRENITATGLSGARVQPVPVERFLAGGSGGAVDLAFLDPPYDLDEHRLQAVLEALIPWLTADALLVVERSARSPEPVWPSDVELLGPRRHGETTLWLAEYVPEGEVA